ncbi:nucleotidyltransferase domain-containing protein [Streptomyces sp. NPDC056883]|uniref:nucleotidyltransferase domain-containing protein n=1 Tax=Streptomyces sp. NPDC056883 TaxID=3345959 RepID=UPI003697333C
MTAEPPPGGVEITQAEAEARWAHAWTPAEVAARLVGVRAPWYVAGGWAVDLFTGGPPRPHGDLEIAVPAGSFPEIRARFPEFGFDVVAYDRLWEFTPEASALGHQTWLRDPASGNFLVDVFREPHDGETWIYRRDPSVRLPYTAVVCRTPDGIPYLAPELALLFKAKAVRPKDQQDFARALPLLDEARRTTLAELVEREHPGHAWLADLRPGGARPAGGVPDGSDASAGSEGFAVSDGNVRP